MERYDFLFYQSLACASFLVFAVLLTERDQIAIVMAASTETGWKVLQVGVDFLLLKKLGVLLF